MVPYSEHSSFDELVAFVQRIRPTKVTPTVNADTAKDREKISKHFLPFTNLAADKGRLDHYFKRPPQKSIAGADDEATLLLPGHSDAHPPRDKGKEIVTIDDDHDHDDHDDGKGGGGGRGGGGGGGGGGGTQHQGGGDCGVDPETLAALGAFLTPAELRQQTALWEEAQRSTRAVRGGQGQGVMGGLSRDTLIRPTIFYCFACITTQILKSHLSVIHGGVFVMNETRAC